MPRNAAGTHDLALTARTMEALKGLKTPTAGATPRCTESESGAGQGERARDQGEGEVLIPQYDKSLRGGRGDRAEVSQWVKARGES